MTMGGEEPEFESGTIVSWDVQSGAGRVLADRDDQALFVHQVDLIFTGAGRRFLPLWHQCEFVRSTVNGSHVACKVTRSNRRPYHFEKKEEDVKAVVVALPTPEGATNDLLHKKLQNFECVVTTNESIDRGKVYYFHGEYRYGVIIPDYDREKRFYADATSFNVVGSYLNVRKGICVEFQTGKSKDGQEVAVNITGENREAIDYQTRVESLTNDKATGKRKNKRKGANAKKKLKTAATIKETKPEIPDGKNPISIFYEFANSCNPKKTPSIKLVSQNTRSSGMVSDFTFESRLDDKPIAQGQAKTKKDAKTYAAWFALEALEKESSVYKQEINRIKQGIPSVKKQMRSFTKRKWRGKFNNNNHRSNSYNPQPSTSFMYSPAAIVVPQITHTPATAVSLTTYAQHSTNYTTPSAVNVQNASTTAAAATATTNASSTTSSIAPTKNYTIGPIGQPQPPAQKSNPTKLDAPSVSYSSYTPSTNNSTASSSSGNRNSFQNNAYSNTVSNNYQYTTATSAAGQNYYTPTESATINRGQQQQQQQFRQYNNTFSYTTPNNSYTQQNSSYYGGNY